MAADGQSNRGRKIKYTEEIATEIEHGILTGLTNTDAARAAGISEDTFIRWCNGYRGVPANFAVRMEQAKAQRSRLWLGVIRRAATGTTDNKGKVITPPDWKAAAELLDRCAPEYRKQPRVELTGRDGGPVRHTHDVTVTDRYDYSHLTLQEQFELDQLLARVQERESAGVD